MTYNIIKTFDFAFVIELKFALSNYLHQLGRMSLLRLR